jgi:hypothetical protein
MCLLLVLPEFRYVCNQYLISSSQFILELVATFINIVINLELFVL